MASLIEAINIKRKMFFEFENAPYHCIDVDVSKPTARGGQTLVRLKMRNLLTRAVFDKTFKAGEKFSEPDLVTVDATYLYADGSGSDEVTYRIDLPSGIDPAGLRVRATLYYQALPPYMLRDLFDGAPDGPAARRLHHLASRVDLKGTPIAGWKLRIASAESTPGNRPPSGIGVDPVRPEARHRPASNRANRPRGPC